MATPASRLQRSKRVEVEVQQFLWPGSIFAGGAKRPALEHEDLRGPDREGLPLWGEVKNYAWETIIGAGGPWAVLAKALQQCREAIARSEGTFWACPEARPFAVLWPLGSRRQDQRLVMFEHEGRTLVVTLDQFRELVIDDTPVESLPEDATGDSEA